MFKSWDLILRLAFLLVIILMACFICLLLLAILEDLDRIRKSLKKNAEILQEIVVNTNSDSGRNERRPRREIEDCLQGNAENLELNRTPPPTYQETYRETEAP
ncbi:unnamed protein product, partial [Mesorhabditis belari]|uniref:Uncharacterized protein n=1 Tax=Mesorhabditis belari TaxID=2138241 RepID=A0AAF3FER7_9BILA